MDKRFLSIMAAIIVIFIGFAVFSGKSDNKSSNNSNTTSSVATNHVKGSGQKGVTLIEYGDFQCAVCELYEPTIKQVYEKYAADITFQFRNLPLVSVHPNAFAAARAAEAASLQNKFWEMHDMLYEPVNWQAWTNSSNPRTFFDSYAQKLGLNQQQFKQDFESNQVNDLVNKDLAEFGKTGQPMATPTFFIDGQLVNLADLRDPTTGSPNIDRFSAVIDAAITKKPRQ